MSERDNYKLKTKLGGLAVSTLLRGWMGTLDFKVAHYDQSADPARPDFGGHCIHLFWHEYITFPVTIWGHCDMAALVSRHRDGDWISRAANHLGFDIVRGSTTRGGASALRELKRRSRHCNLTIMPDGPQGPRRKMSVGPIFLASRLQVPIVPVGFGYDRPWRFNSWDRFALPRPFSRARSIFGPRIQLPRKLNRDGLEDYRLRIESLLNDLTQQAEAWAESGQRLAGQTTLTRQASRRRLLSLDESSHETKSCSDSSARQQVRIAA
jgi:lysophospholipid acyltransferase (LPLAT)-like uncharacterized protein